MNTLRCSHGRFSTDVSADLRSTSILVICRFPVFELAYPRQYLWGTKQILCRLVCKTVKSRGLWELNSISYRRNGLVLSLSAQFAVLRQAPEENPRRTVKFG